jgi:hypothetical protein
MTDTTLLAELREAITLEGFGCACMPLTKCGTCNARDVLAKVIGPIIKKHEAAAIAAKATEGAP